MNQYTHIQVLVFALCGGTFDDSLSINMMYFLQYTYVSLNAAPQIDNLLVLA